MRDVSVLEIRLNSIVCFFDILGTASRVKKGEFDDIEALDFVNPVGLVAMHNSDMRFAVFSDSVIISCPKKDAKDFIAVVSYLYSQWFADIIIVRGGVSVGEINWVDDSNTDEMFRRLKNLSFSRVYGKALVAAHTLEERSGPGAICFLDESASELFRCFDDKYILSGTTNALIWPDKRTLDYLLKVLPGWKDSYNVGDEARRQISATIDYFEKAAESKKWHPDGLLYSAVGSLIGDTKR
jgi:hypothetical protein